MLPTDFNTGHCRINNLQRIVMSKPLNKQKQGVFTVIFEETLLPRPQIVLRSKVSITKKNLSSRFRHLILCRQSKRVSTTRFFTILGVSQEDISSSFLFCYSACIYNHVTGRLLSDEREVLNSFCSDSELDMTDIG